MMARELLHLHDPTTQPLTPAVTILKRPSESLTCRTRKSIIFTLTITTLDRRVDARHLSPPSASSDFDWNEEKVYQSMPNRSQSHAEERLSIPLKAAEKAEVTEN